MIGKTLGHYRVVEQLSRGGMGEAISYCAAGAGGTAPFNVILSWTSLLKK